MLIDEITRRAAAVGDRDGWPAVLRAERDAAGTAMLLIEQNVTFALAVADRYAVLKLGEIVDRGAVGRMRGVEQRITAHLSV